MLQTAPRFSSRALLVILALIPLGEAPRAQTLSGATAQPSQTSLTLPAGGSAYIYGMATGGLYPSSSFSQGNYQQLTDASGELVADLAVTNSNSNSFSTSAAYYTIGGVGVSGFTNMAQSFGSNNSPGAPSASDTFAVTQRSLVVVVAMAGGQSYLTLSGVPGLQVDAQVGSQSGGVIGMVIAHATLSPGTYTVTENSSPSPAPGQDPNHMADLIGVFIFSGGSLSDSVNLSTPCVNGLQVDINGAASPGASVTSISWNWGDGTTTTGFFPQSHTYSTANSYNVQVTANYNDGSSASTSQNVTVGLGILSNCLALTIAVGQGGSVSYQASVGAGTIPPGASQTLQLDFADDLTLTANGTPGNSFTTWAPSAGITGLGGSPVATTSSVLSIVVTASSSIRANFSFASGASAVPTTVTISANPPSISEASSTPSTIAVTVFDQNGFAMPGVPVNFSSNTGSLSAGTATTDANGLAFVTLSLGYTSQAPVTASVSATAGTVTSTSSVKFVPPATVTGYWGDSSAFQVTLFTLPLGQYLSTSIGAYNFLSGSSINASSLPTANVYLITPANLLSPNEAQFASAVSTYFGISVQNYNPAALVILELPVVQAANILFNANLASPVSACLTGDVVKLLNGACLESTSEGYINLAFTISLSTSSQQAIRDLLQAVATDLAAIGKQNYSDPTSAILNLESNLQPLLDVADLTVSVITTDLDQAGTLTSSTLLDFSGLPTKLNNALGTVFAFSAMFGKVVSVVDSMGQFAGAVGGDLGTCETVVGCVFFTSEATLDAAQMAITSLDLAVEILPTLNTSPQNNQLYQDFETALNIVTTFVDPPGATIMPSFFDSEGNLVLGYDANTSTIRYASPNGILFPNGNGYIALLTENPSSPSNYSEILNTVGTATGPMPYVIQIRSYNPSQPIQSYNGMLTGGSSVTVPIEFIATNGSLIPQPSLSPILSVNTSGNVVAVTAKAFLSDGSPATAAQAFFILNGQESSMTQVDESTFETSFADNLTAPTTATVYMIAPNLPGGFATTVLAPISAPSLGTACNGIYNGVFTGDLRISEGQNCTFVGGAITGSVIQNGGSLSLSSTAIGGNLIVSGGGNFLIGPFTTIMGEVQVQNIPAGSGQEQLCGTVLEHDLQFHNNEVPVLIGSGSPFCPGNILGGSLLVMNNSASTQASQNAVEGNLVIMNNAGPTQVFNNNVTNLLQCRNNSSITGDGNTARLKLGQCSAF